MNLRNIIFIASLVLMNITLIAQPTTKVTYETKLEVADEAARSSDYYTAIKWFGEAYKESKDITLQIVMGDMYALARDYKRAAKIYERVIKRDKNGDFFELKADLGRMYKYQGLYKEAVTEFQKVLADTEVSDEVKEEVKRELAGIESMDGLNDNLEAVIAFMPGKVNSGSAESSPALTPDGTLYFSSFNRSKTIIFDGDQGDYHAKIYSSESDDKGEYKRPKAVNDKVNREGFNSGGVSFSRDGKTMYFTRAKLLNNAIETSQIYMSRKTDRGWGAAELLTNLEGDFNCKHPVEGELFGQKVLYFSSDMDGGKGGYDIYYCDIDSDEFGLPVNLGDIVNTSGDEISPFYINGTLYFSSNGLPNIGGYDIFYSQWNGSSWDDPTNMGFNYNSSYDDMFLRFDNKGSNGFLVSNRPDKNKKKMKGNESCCDDIYTVYIKELVIDLEAIVNDEKGPLKGATIELFDLTLGAYPDSKTGFDNNKFRFQLEADREYKAFVTKDGFYPDSIMFNTNGIIDDYTISKTVQLKPRPEDDKSDVEIITINEPIRLNNIYYDFDKANILPDAEKDLEVLLDLLLEYDDMTIELSSHTDSQGKAPYNQRLSQRRANSAKKWLVEEGIESKRIKAVGYGESVILNHCTDGKRCSDEEHRLNRRTEFKILTGPKTIEIKKEKLKKK